MASGSSSYGLVVYRSARSEAHLLLGEATPHDPRQQFNAPHRAIHRPSSTAQSPASDPKYTTVRRNHETRHATPSPHPRARKQPPLPLNEAAVGGCERLVLLRSARHASGKTTSNYLMILVTRPAPTVREPSRIAKRRPSSMATGWISSTVISTLSPGITISVPSGRVTTPVTSVVRK